MKTFVLGVQRAFLVEVVIVPSVFHVQDGVLLALKQRLVLYMRCLNVQHERDQDNKIERLGENRSWAVLGIDL